MSQAKSIVATSVLSAALVLSVAAPLAYFGLPVLTPNLGQQSSDVPSVVMDLKAELVAEIQTSSDQTRAELTAQIRDADAAQTAALNALKSTVDAIKAEQDQWAARLERPPVPSAAPVAQNMEIPGARAGAFNQTILFPLGAIKAKVIDVQMRDVTAKALEHAKDQDCVSNVLGFSDTLGNDASNLKLSQRRAEYVAGELKAAGLNIGNVKGWGERWLDVHTVDGVKNPKNRRVVVEMICGGDNMPKQMPNT